LLVVIEIRWPGPERAVTRITAPGVGAGFERRQLTDVTDPYDDRRVGGYIVEEMVRYLPRLVDEEDVIRRFAIVGCTQCGDLSSLLAGGSELVTRRDDDAALWRDRGGGRGDRDLPPYVVRDVGQSLFGDEEADCLLPEALSERCRETVGLPVSEGDDGDPR